VHAHFPQALDFSAMLAKPPIERLRTAFAIAEKFGCPQLLDPEVPTICIHSDVVKYVFD
jgi:hypothetical protein